jgi:phosphoribosylamine--glycine ligase
VDVERVGVLVVTYGSRGAALIDAFHRSDEYEVELYVADRNRNPFNVAAATAHAVIPDLDVAQISRFTEKHAAAIDFGVVGPEKPIINGVRDTIERRTGIPMICPTQRYALEGSKAAQRRLFRDVAPAVNPRFRIFDPAAYATTAQVKAALWSWLDELADQCAVKPAGITAGKGVGVWGDHFTDRERLYDHFVANYAHGPVIVEEKVRGEESSFQAFCDGKHLVPLPETRDYKRAFDGDQGPNTGGMGSYKDVDYWLPFQRREEWDEELRIMQAVFSEVKGRGSNPGLRGIPFYTAFMHTGRGPKILEVNSRPGDPEIMNILPVLRDDLVDLCFAMIDGSLTQVQLRRVATVVTYKVPPTYGERETQFTGDTEVKLDRAYRLDADDERRVHVYPGSMTTRDDRTYALTSRTVAAVGVAEDLAAARVQSLRGLRAIEGGALWHRTDIASSGHIARSVEHMNRLRG